MTYSDVLIRIRYGDSSWFFFKQQWQNILSQCSAVDKRSQHRENRFYLSRLRRFRAQRLGPVGWMWLLYILFFLLCMLLASPLYVKKAAATMHCEVEADKEMTMEVMFERTARAVPVASQNIHPGSNTVSLDCSPVNVRYFKLRFAGGPGALTIRNLRFAGKKGNEKEVDLARMTARGAELESAAAGLKVQTSNPDFSITGPEDFHFRPGRNVKVGMALLSTACSLLLAAYVPGWLARRIFRRKKQLRMSPVGASVSLLFVAFLMVPFCTLETRDIDYVENRGLAVFPSLVTEDGFNWNFSKEFDVWLQDRFGGRHAYIDFYTDTTSLVDGVVQNQKAVAYPDGWMFYKQHAASADAEPTDAELRIIMDGLRKVNAFCKDNGIRFYVLFCPIKDELYRHHDRQRQELKVVRTSLLVDYLRKQLPDVPIVWPLKEMQDSVGDESTLLHYMTDTHQTDDGAFIINQALMEVIHADFPDVPVLTQADKDLFDKSANILVRVGPEDGFCTGYIHEKGLGLKGNRLLGREYVYYTPPASYGISVQPEGSIPMERISTCGKGVREAFFIGDSYTEQQVTWLQCSFAKLTKLRANNNQENNDMRFDRWQERLKQEKPDVLIFCVSSSDSIYHLMNLYNG